MKCKWKFSNVHLFTCVFPNYRIHIWDQFSSQMVKSLPAMWEIPGWGRSPGEGNGNPLQYSCLENPMDGGPWRATVHGVAKSQLWLSNFTFFFPVQFNCSVVSDSLRLHGPQHARLLCPSPSPRACSSSCPLSQ